MRVPTHASKAAAIALLILTMAPCAAPAEEPLPYYLQDRGTGVATSLFGSYVRGGELLVYPFYEYVKASKAEYHGSELGFFGDTDYLGKEEGHEAVLFLGYGLTDDLAIELEGEVYVTQTLQRAPDDTTSGIPEELEESGFGELEAQIRWRFAEETESRPELFSNLEVTFPLQEDKILIGASDWEVAVGLGIVKGFRWGTLTSRVSIGYEAEEGEVKLSEYAIEYLKRTSESWRWVAAIEGEDDEVVLVLEGQWHLGPHAYWKFNTGFGVTEKAEDFAPEIGVMLSF